ncbi:Predicted O-methyltransferase YrrM [Bhargavaea ginsengi]|uniref:tRNA 5-hydroxyuridine methyltransferase n=1 Tax=Bhargavaea ginsengi TaxID=426757 RepID=A0A1H6X526_9BACL|nr:O-methyltransferase [Bhargavaea ginsengi]SEJ23166.1 Predicted O-methyltransferase YrrM [Bhargavaea ginsengi]
MMEHEYSRYSEGLIPSRPERVLEMERYAREHRVPIMQLEGMEALLQILRVQRPKRILEIGTAIGYSAIRMAEALPGTQVVTIEREPAMQDKAENNIGESDAAERIRLVRGDALELGDNLPEGPFDALFIDAAKGQYKRFFDIYEPLLSDSGVIYCDNMFMHGLAAENPKDIPKKNRTMIRKLKEFTEWLMSHPGYDSALLPVGDGLMISTKKESTEEGAVL